MKKLLFIFSLVLVLTENATPAFQPGMSGTIKQVGEFSGGYKINRFENDEVICYTAGYHGMQCKWKF